MNKADASKPTKFLLTRSQLSKK